jgi:hypothetical protein
MLHKNKIARFPNNSTALRNRHKFSASEVPAMDNDDASGIDYTSVTVYVFALSCSQRTRERGRRTCGGMFTI